ncbi:Flp family type IVb pilin [Egicoccus sp. AB-alg2]|uniref:Flp family type IVb pilin n=1 Tax=Egicoccus sp. AB-alg2 TaxID=3242693 RepID=UPI00359D61EE
MTQDLFIKLAVARNNFVARTRDGVEGATAVEYGLMVALIAVAIIGAVRLIGTNLDTMFDGVANDIAGT